MHHDACDMKHLKGSAMANSSCLGKHYIIQYCSTLLEELIRPFYSGVQEKLLNTLQKAKHLFKHTHKHTQVLEKQQIFNREDF